jgi:hypothetical protein
MSTVSIEQMNAAMALFVGMELKQDIDDPGFEWEWIKGPNNSFWPNKTPPPFDKCWDWLMPVGKKIHDLLAEMAKKRPPHTACIGDVIEVDITCALHEYDIVKVHENIYMFILWYNSQNP